MGTTRFNGARARKPGNGPPCKRIFQLLKSRQPPAVRPIAPR